MRVTPLELYRRQVTTGTLVVFRVVGHFDVVKHVDPRGVFRLVDPTSGSLALEQTEEAFHGRVVVAVAPSARRRDTPDPRQLLSFTPSAASQSAGLAFRKRAQN